MNSYFDAIYVINLDRREDRWRALKEEMSNWGFARHHLDPWLRRWRACDSPDDGHYGCTRSHRELLARIADGPHQRVLVLEDDVEAVTPGRLIAAKFPTDSAVWRTHVSLLGGGGSVCERFDALIPFLPPTWDVLYLGAGYGEPPRARYNKHVLRVGRMMTTSSYGITRDFARTWTDLVNERWPTLEEHPGPIDSTFGLFSHGHLYYCLQPRLFYQRASLSDITRETNSYLFSMTDPVHENLL